MADNCYVPFNIHEVFDRKLNSDIIIPSTAHGYSICIQFMEKYFKDKFEKEYFKSIYVDTKHVLDEYRMFDKVDHLKKAKPLVSILPEIDLNFDREGLDTPMFGLTMHAHPFKDSFFKDKKNNVYLGLTMELLLMNFTFRCRFSTRAQQLDIFKKMKMAFRVGMTEGRHVSMDFHVPYELMLRLAKQMYFEIKDDKIVDIIAFTRYLNQHSQYIFIYKFRPMTGNNEFFIRIDDIFVHIANTEIDAGAGEREGFLMHNFDIEMRTTVRFPVPKYYTHYSINKYSDMLPAEPIDGDVVVAHALVFTDIPDWNDKGWDLFLTTEYEEDDIKDKPLMIDFTDLFTGTDIQRVIDECNKIYVSPETFMDIKVFNDGDPICGEMNWETLTYKSNEMVTHTISAIAIYVDNEYMNSQLENIKQQKGTRYNE